MSIVKWSNVRLKTKDKKIITGQIEEKDEICVVKEENSKEQLGEVVYTLRSVEHPDVTEKVISDCFSEIGFGLYRNDHMFI